MAAIIFEGYHDIAQIKNKPKATSFRSYPVKKNIQVRLHFIFFKEM